MSTVGKNIKKIRSVKKISQQAFADSFNITRASIGSYEEGRADPKIGLVMEIANKFNISVERLLNNEITINDISGFSRYESSIDKGKALNPDGNQRLIPFVSANNCSVYLENLSSEQYLSFIPRFELPNFEHKKARAFEVVGNDMWHMEQGYPPKSTLVCVHANFQKPQLLKELATYVFILREKVLIRQLVFGQKQIIARAINPFFEDVILDMNEVIELWEAHSLIAPVKPINAYLLTRKASANLH
ncbi:MAG: helix-turn-helix transcriptional regulator [Bacteroidetes bacterium]|nr:helix-turn-helix transcriptional regulator [Bacteroidota bacterium]